MLAYRTNDRVFKTSSEKGGGYRSPHLFKGIGHTGFDPHLFEHRVAKRTCTIERLQVKLYGFCGGDELSAQLGNVPRFLEAVPFDFAWRELVEFVALRLHLANEGASLFVAYLPVVNRGNELTLIELEQIPAGLFTSVALPANGKLGSL